MIDTLDIQRTLFTVSDFLDWQRQGTLNLDPPFQRRSVWRTGAKSYLIDTVVRGLPTPLLFIRSKIDADTLRPMREVIDGQQRLRTLIGFIEESALPDFNPERDRFTVQKQHNAEISDTPFKKLSTDLRRRILGYEFSTHVLPSDTEDRDVLMIFQRLNSTGTPLNYQELRNATYFGYYKTVMYQLAYEQFERWLKWRIFNEDQIARMLEVELTSDLVQNMIQGLGGKSQPNIDKFYGRHNDEFKGRTEVSRRFRRVMDEIENVIGDNITRTVFTSEVYFFTLFTYLYDRMYGLASDLKKRDPKSLPRGLEQCLQTVSRNFRTEDVPLTVLDAVQRASSDVGRRRTRLKYMHDTCDGKSAG